MSSLKMTSSEPSKDRRTKREEEDEDEMMTREAEKGGGITMSIEDTVSVTVPH